MLNSQYSYLSPTFSVTGSLTSTCGNLSMQLHSPHLSTRDFPLTLSVLKKRLPSVLSAECFNQKGLPFAVEVQNTHLAHLFEHLLLEKLCLETLGSGMSHADFSGRTTWDWTASPYGSYSIFLSACQQDASAFRSAFAASVSILEDILRLPADKKQAA